MGHESLSKLRNLFHSKPHPQPQEPSAPSERKPTPENPVLFQAFEWNVPSDNAHWKRLTRVLPDLEHIGITSLWLPPGCKAANKDGNGYDIYDLWDLGEFEQKGARATKWGPKEDLVELSNAAKEKGVALYWDAVLNHKAGADHCQKCHIVEVHKDDRTKETCKPYEIDAWLGFEFPGRGDKYSSMRYHRDHFTGTDFNQANGQTAIYKICGDNKGWAEDVDDDQGNADYMMFADVDYRHPDVQSDVKNWGPWITNELGLKGFRLDAVQHFSARFTNEWIDRLRHDCGSSMFIVGEFWHGDVRKLLRWFKSMHEDFSLFDSPLVYNFQRISTSTDADLRTVFKKSLVEAAPHKAVTVVMNHDTQPGSTVDTHIESWFKPLAYSLVLLREQGYPSVFYGDLYGTKGPRAEPPSCGGKLADLILARKLYAYGAQEDYFNNANCIGWVRHATWDHPAGLACVLGNDKPSQIRMAVGKEHAGERWTDVLGWQEGEVEIDKYGHGVFRCGGISVSVWVRKNAEGREQFPTNFDSNIYPSWYE